MPEPAAPALVTLHLWRVRRARVPSALARVVAHDVARWRRVSGAGFSRALGTSRGFTPRTADPCRWALLTTWASRGDVDAFERSQSVRSWNRIAEERWRVDLHPLAARGRWSGHAPFGPRLSIDDERQDEGQDEGAVAALTRARLAPRKLVTFWRATPPVAAALDRAAGLRLALGIGEAPVALQGTFSVWQSAAALRSYAHGSAPHREVVRRTPRERWYAEELFARFAVVGSHGTVDGADPLA